MLSFGDPTPYVAEIKAAGATLICQVELDLLDLNQILRSDTPYLYLIVSKIRYKR